MKELFQIEFEYKYDSSKIEIFLLANDIFIIIYRFEITLFYLPKMVHFLPYLQICEYS